MQQSDASIERGSKLHRMCEQHCTWRHHGHKMLSWHKLLLHPLGTHRVDRHMTYKIKKLTAR